MRNPINNEPVLTVGAVLAAVTAAVAFVRAMGWLQLTDEQYNSLLTFVGLLLPILGALWARARVTPLENPQARTATGKLVALVREDTGRAPTPPSARRQETPQ